MTNADVFVQILSEVSGKPESLFREMLGGFRKMSNKGKWDEELTPAEAETLIVSLRKEAPGILNWMVHCTMAAHNGTQ